MPFGTHTHVIGARILIIITLFPFVFIPAHKGSNNKSNNNNGRREEKGWLPRGEKDPFLAPGHSEKILRDEAAEANGSNEEGGNRSRHANYQLHVERILLLLVLTKAS